MNVTRCLLSVLFLGIFAVAAASQEQYPPRVVLATPDYDFQWVNPNAAIGEKLPGFLDVPVYIRRPRYQKETLDVNELDLWFAMQPVKTDFEPFAIQHLVGNYFHRTIWIDGLTPRPGEEEILGSARLGALWNVERPPGPAGGADGFGWIHLHVQRLPKLPTGNWADIDWTDPGIWNVEGDGLVATVRVRMPRFPGVWIFNTNAVQRPEKLDRLTKTHVWGSDNGRRTDREIIHDFGLLVIREPSEWKAAGYSLEPLSIILPSGLDETPIDPLPVTIDALLARERAFDMGDSK